MKLFVLALLIFTSLAQAAPSALNKWYVAEMVKEVTQIQSEKDNALKGNACTGRLYLQCYQDAYAKAPARTANSAALWLSNALILCSDKSTGKFNQTKAADCVSWLWKNLDFKKFLVNSMPADMVAREPGAREKAIAVESPMLEKNQTMAEKILQKAIDQALSPLEKDRRTKELRELKIKKWKIH